MPALQSELRAAARDASQRDAGAWPTGWKASAAPRPPISQLGADRFAQMIRDTEMVDMPLAELEADRPRRPAAQPAAR